MSKQSGHECKALLPAVPSRVYGVTPEVLAELEAELEVMHVAVEKASKSARFNSYVIVGGGLGLLLTQWALFVRLTYFELSWQGCMVYRCSPRHPPHDVPVLAASSIT